MAEPSSGNLTIAEVRDQLAAAGIDPRETNARVVRDMVGRGSLATIQKHLESLRAELAPPPPEPAAVPPAPADLVAQLWGAAWTAAHGSAMERLADAQARADSMASDLAIARSDNIAALSLGDTQAALIAALRLEIEHAAAAAAAAAEAAADALHKERETAAAAAAAAAATEAELREQITSMHAAKELQDARHDATSTAQQREVDRLVNMLADLRAGLKDQETPAPAPAPRK